MPNMTLSIPNSLHQQMRAHPEISWSEIARQAIAKRIEREAEFEKMLAMAKEEEQLPEELRKIAGSIKKAGAKRFMDAPRRGHKYSHRGAAARRHNKKAAATPKP